MAATPTVTTFADGQLTTAQINAGLGTPAAFAIAMPVFHAYSTSTQNVATSGLMTTIVYQIADIDNYTGWTGGSGTGIYVVQYAGVYLALGAIAWAANATGLRGGQWVVNGSLPGSQIPFYLPNNGAGSGANSQPPGTLLKLAVGDQVAMQGQQFSGGALSTQVGCMMSLAMLSRSS